MGYDTLTLIPSLMNHGPAALHLLIMRHWHASREQRYSLRIILVRMQRDQADHPFYLLVHTEQPLRPRGPNSGAEMATLNHARYLAKAGKRVVLASCIDGPVALHDGVEYWDLGPEYDVETALDKADRKGSYFLISAGRSLALFMARKRKPCLVKLLITHDRCAGDSGIKPHVLPHLADTILCVSDAQREKLISEGAPGDRMVVIHNGVDFEVFAPSPPADHDPKRLVFSGALVPDKGLHLLLNSFVDLLKRFPDLKLDVFGDASLWSRNEYLNIDQLSASIPGLTFHGKKPQQEIADGFRRAGICVVPSIWFDPFPLTSLEAQACGCPVVVFNVGGLVEGVSQGVSGIVIDQVDQDALTTALYALLSQPDRIREMSQASARYIAETFRWENVVSRIIALCEQEKTETRPIGWMFDENGEISDTHYARAARRTVLDSLTRNRNH